MEKQIMAALSAEADNLTLPPNLLGRIKQQAAHPARRPWFRSARGLAASVALAAAVAAGIIVMPSFGPNPNVVMAMTQAVDNLQRYHGVMTDGTEVWRDGDKFAVKYAQLAIPGALNRTVSDGNQAWAFSETTKHAVTYPLTGVEMAVQPNLRAIAGYALRNPHRTVGQETVSGRSTTKIEIFASQGRIVLSYRDANIAEGKADGALQSDSNAAWGTAAGGPLRVDLRGASLKWVQNGLAITASTTPGLSDHYIALARQMAPDLTLPAPAQGPAGAAKVK
ncbi:MAG: hypothetical protein JWN15_613 [Firmicutes bacterium]|nr:hypothetical protein [Bacillota bacterium]